MKPISFKPANGGRLLSGLSSGNVGMANYMLKRDWRRGLGVEMRAEGHVKFAPNPDGDETEQAYPPSVTGAITLIAEATLPSGQRCAVCGTQTTLWAYFGLDDPTYVDGDGNGLYVEAGYFDDNPGDWLQIGSGFSAVGSRWEAVPVGSWLVLNNGVDLPMTYRVGESSVVPIYELREQGIASVGTIAETNGILCCMDIRQIPTQTHTDLMTPISAAVSGVVGAVRFSGLAVRNSLLTLAIADSPVFMTSMIGETIRFASGRRDVISDLFSAEPSAAARLTELQGPDITPPQPFYLITDTANRVTPDAATLFPSQVAEDLIGMNLIWASGEVAKITSVSGGYFYVNSDKSIPLGALTVENPEAYGLYSGPVERRHSRDIWSMPNLPRRFAAQIPCVVDPNSNAVALTWPAKSLVSGMSVLIVGAGAGGNNLTADILLAYPNSIILKDQAITDASADIAAAITAASEAESSAREAATSAAATLESAQQSLSAATATLLLTPDSADLKAAQASASASVDAALASNTAAANAYTVAQAATQTARDAAQPLTTTLVAADAEASIAGLFEDLEGDGSGITKALKFGQFLAIYKTTGSIFLARYTGSLTAPFDFTEIKVPHECCLPEKHRFTLIAPDDNTHIYAAGQDIYEFNTSMRIPRLFVPLQNCSETFFSAAGDDKFSCNNALTKEIMFCIPSSQGSDKALCYDYLYDTARTTGQAWTAGATLHRPSSQSEVWFVGGTSLGGLMRYGMVETNPIQSLSITATKAANSSALTASSDIFTKAHIGHTIKSSSGKYFAITGYTSATQVTVIGSGSITAESFTIVPFVWHRDGEDYDSILRSGLDDFGSAHYEKLMNSYVLIPSSKSANTAVSIAFRAGENPATARISQSALMASPNTKNLLKPTVLAYYLGDQLTISGSHNPFELQERVVTVVPRMSGSFGRRGNGT